MTVPSFSSNYQSYPELLCLISTRPHILHSKVGFVIQLHAIGKGWLNLMPANYYIESRHITGRHWRRYWLSCYASPCKPIVSRRLSRVYAESTRLPPQVFRDKVSSTAQQCCPRRLTNFSMHTKDHDEFLTSVHYTPFLRRSNVLHYQLTPTCLSLTLRRVRNIKDYSRVRRLAPRFPRRNEFTPALTGQAVAKKETPPRRVQCLCTTSINYAPR